MAKIKPLSCLKKRDYLNTRVFAQEECIKYGELYQKQGLLSDAIDFFAKAEANEKLEAILPLIITEGDVFLFTKIYHALKIAPSAAAWQEIAETALKLGKWQFALKAFQAADHKEKVREIEQLLETEEMPFALQASLPFLKQETLESKKQKPKKK
jgi:tetratricopeptide (TPR) repeat protein